MSNLPLINFPEGSKVIIISFKGGRKMRARLYDMGLTPGTTVTITSQGPGPCRIKVRGFDLVLGRGIAAKIIASLKKR